MQRLLWTRGGGKKICLIRLAHIKADTVRALATTFVTRYFKYV